MFVAAFDGRAFQTSLQYIRQFGSLYSRLLCTDVWRRADVGFAGGYPLPRLGRRKTIISIPNHGYAHVTIHVGFGLIPNQVCW